MAGLDDAARFPARWPPVRIEDLAQGAGLRIDESRAAELAELVRQRAPARITALLGPVQRGLEQVHLGVRLVRPFAVVLPEAARAVAEDAADAVQQDRGPALQFSAPVR